MVWHPDGRGLDYVDRHGPGHRVHSFDITSRRREATSLPHAEHAVLGAGRSPVRRIALLSGDSGVSGLWVEGDGTWWRVPGSEPNTTDLEALRLRLPRWSRDGKRLAFVDGNSVRVCDAVVRQTETWFRSDVPPADLHWHPDGTRLGAIDGSRLVLLGPSGWVRPLTFLLAPQVTEFAGWNAAGDRMACVAVEPLPYRAGGAWATLFVPNAKARTVVCVADAEGADARPLVSGLRATFPNWSQTEPRLSAWLTVEPPYRLPTAASECRPATRPC